PDAKKSIVYDKALSLWEEDQKKGLGDLLNRNQDLTTIEKKVLAEIAEIVADGQSPAPVAEAPKGPANDGDNHEASSALKERKEKDSVSASITSDADNISKEAQKKKKVARVKAQITKNKV